MFYTLLKALTKQKSFGGGLVSGDIVIPEIRKEPFVYLTAQSFGGLYGIRIYRHKVEMKLIDNFGVTWKEALRDIVEPEYLAIIFSFLEMCWPELYTELFRESPTEYNMEYIKQNLDKLCYTKVRRDGFTADIYLGIFALFGIPQSGGAISFAKESSGPVVSRETDVDNSDILEIVYTKDGPDLDLVPVGVDWAYMGRALWYHLCHTVASQ